MVLKKSGDLPASGMKAPKKAASGKTKVPLFAFRIELRGVRPKIWRYFFVPSNISLYALNSVILDVMGWSGGHLFGYRIPGYKFSLSEDVLSFGFGYSGFLNMKPIEKISLRSLGLSKGSAFIHEYDFGDGWEHVLKVMNEDYQPKEPGRLYGCYGGKRACPPEDCGGIYGYETLLETIADPKHPEHKSMMEWLGGGFDPEEFDPMAIDALLSSRR